MSVRFSKRPERTAEGGRKYPAETLIHVGVGVDEVVRVATEEDKKRHPVAWADFSGPSAAAIARAQDVEDNATAARVAKGGGRLFGKGR